MALKSQGVILKRAGTEVAEISGFNGPDGEATEIDVTHLRSVAHEYLQGLPNEGNITFTGFLNPSDTAQAGLRTDRDAQVANSYSLTLTNTPPTVLSFSAFVKQFALAGAPDGAITLNLSMRITGAVTWS
jgi:hypothetical protein